MSTATLQESITARLDRRLRQALGAQRYALWLGRSALLDYHEDDATLHVTLAHRFAADAVQKRCAEPLRTALDQEVGPHAQIAYHVDPARFGDPATEEIKPTPQNSKFEIRNSKSSPSFARKLDDFIVGPSNELAYAAAVQMADEHADAALLGQPLFIHGGCGLGKTHLLQGICQRVLAYRPHARVRYCTGEQFTNDYIQAVRENRLVAFRAAVRRLDLLAVDDLHFLSAKEKTQQEFLHTFDQIDLDGARLVLASDSHPRQIKMMSQGLISRCVRGLVVQINAPDAVTRRALVRELARRRGLQLGTAAVEQVAERCQGSVRDIEGVLTKLHAMTNLTRSATSGPVGAVMVEQVLAHETRPTLRRPVRFEAILETVAGYFGLTARQINGSGRARQLVLARSLLVKLARQLTPMSYPEIAAQMGRRNHSTVITAAQRIERQIAAAERVLMPGAGDMSVGDLLNELQRLAMNQAAAV
ncbi:MAG: ATP-binding protein [Phycisphaeraceae bacterium]|nr:ATP-binding protein [Phycisphaeraceae bacterium]